ncbi:MAG: DUF3147 family protein [Silicimonas sp.]|uniref:DUF3147 family protein n=1 Tax=Roseitalea porphyridii TaxID=1852022 RepID=UPI0032EFE27D
MSLFFFKLLSGALLGGLWVVLALYLGRRFSGRIGGMVGGLPSTVLLSFLLVGWIQGAEFAFEATHSFPAAYSAGALSAFLCTFSSRYSLNVRILKFILIWFIFQLAIVYYAFDNFWIAMFLWMLLLIFFVLYIRESGLAGEISRRDTSKIDRKEIIIQMLISTSVVASAILVSELGSPMMSGVFAAFPAVFLAVLICSDFGRGVYFSRLIIAPMIISGMLNCITYVLIFRQFVLTKGVLMASVLATLAVIFVASFALIFVFPRIFRYSPSSSSR